MELDNAKPVIKVVRLNSGEEILASIHRCDGDWLLQKPCIIIPAGQGNIGIMSWLGYCDTKKGVRIPEKFVAFMVDPSEDLAAEYNRATSPIITPNKKLSLVGE